jgi:uncharacterized Zn-binding protein involved in type VI secretion
MKVGVNPPRTPVTKGSSGIAAATIPNVCKMPGPPAPFVPTPLPNIGKSGDNLADCTKKVKFEGKEVAIKGASFKSMGDMPSKGTGGGLVSATTHGSTKFVAPGSMDVKAEGKNIQLLGDATTNDNSNPPNSGTVALAQATSVPEIEAALVQIAKECEEKHGQPADPKDCNKKGTEKHACCDEKIKDAKKEDVFSDPAYKKGAPGTLIQKANGMPRERGAFVRQAIGLAKSLGAPFSAMIPAFLRGKMFPDVVVSGGGPPTPGNVSQVYDFKFPCPATKKPKWGQKGKQGQNLQALTNCPNAPQMVSPLGVFP